MKFRKRVEYVEAMEFRNIGDLQAAMTFLGEKFEALQENSATGVWRVAFQAPAGTFYAECGDWIVKDESGDFDVYSAKDFKATFNEACENESWECKKIQREQDKRIDSLEKAAKEARDMISHAIELDYLGEGSTRGWAQTVLTSLKKVVGNI